MPSETFIKIINTLGITANIQIMFGEETPNKIANAGIKNVIGIDLKKSIVGRAKFQIRLFQFRRKLKNTPIKTAQSELKITRLAVDKKASITSLSEKLLKKSL